MEKQIYFKLLNKEENHNDFQFKTGLNIDTIPFNTDKNQKCAKGGIYFSKNQNILHWLYNMMYWIREVEIPEDAQVIEFDDKLRADKVILKERMAISDVKTWEYLIEKGVDIHADDDYALRWAANGHLEIVKFLVEKGADIHARNNYALKWAALNGHLEIVKYFVNQGADIHVDNDCALRYASEKGHLEIVKFLVEKGANIRVDNDCALRWAARDGYLEIVKYLVNQGADIHIDDDYALKWAVANGHLEIVKYLKSL